MSRRSLESQRQLMAPSITSNRASKRFSTYSSSPSFSTTTSTTTINSGMAEIRELNQGLDRLENKDLQQQRFVPSQKKTDELSKLSLGAKLERALGRRMTDQDAVYRPKRSTKQVMTSSTTTGGILNEKQAIKA